MRASIILSLVLTLAAAAALGQPESKCATPSALKGAANPLLRAKLADIPLHIIENRGVHPDPVRFYVEGKDKAIFFARDGITFALRGKDEGWAVKLDFVGASRHVELRGASPRRAVFSYFSGPRANWKTGLRSFGEVVYEEIWPGIDLVYTAEVGALKYRFVVNPGADPARIRLLYRGATSVTKTPEGALRVETPAMAFEDEAPVAWVEDGSDTRTPVESGYAVESVSENEQVVGFEIGRYPADQELVIDPAVFVYCGYIGGSRADGVYGVAVDESGYAYAGGWTQPSPTFPVKVGPITKLPPVPDAGFVMKLDPTGRHIIYSGIIAGARWAGDEITGIAADRAGCAYVIGSTLNDEKSFPVTVGPDLAHNGKTDCFVAKVNAAGTALDYCGYLGGSEIDRGKAIAVDSEGCAYVVGDTGSSDFPTVVGPDTTYNGGGAFIAKLDPTGTRWLYSGFIGRGTTGKGVAVDSRGCAYVVGHAINTGLLPTVVGPRLTMWPNALYEGYVAKVNAAGTALDYCGYFGGAGGNYEDLAAVAVDKEGHAYLAGTTEAPASRLPLAVGPFLKRTPAITDAIVAKLTPDGSGVVYCGVIGGASSTLAGTNGYAVAVDAQGNAFVAGGTGNSGLTFPVKEGPQLTEPGGGDGWIAMIDRSGRYLQYCGYIGGAFADIAQAIAVTPSGSAVVGGWTNSGEMSGFPVTAGPDLTHNLGGSDGFIAKIGFDQFTVSGSGQVGTTVTFDFTSPGSANLPYQAGSSLGTGPIPIGARKLGLSADDLLVVSVSDALPAVFYRYRGVVDANGTARAELRVPNLAALVGLRIYTALVTLDAGAPHGIRTISDAKMFTVMQ